MPTVWSCLLRRQVDDHMSLAELKHLLTQYYLQHQGMPMCSCACNSLLASEVGIGPVGLPLGTRRGILCTIRLPTTWLTPSSASTPPLC
jgi:hypothetical protein